MRPLPADAAPPGGWTVHRHEELGSTNVEACRLAAEGAPTGTVVTTRRQAAGRGRAGRVWHAPPGQTLAVSIVVRDLDPWSRAPLAAAVAVAETVGGPAAIKWPNDIVFADGPALRKVSGILCEGQPQAGWGVIGIGLNVALDLGTAPPEIAERAASMGRAPDDCDAVLGELLRNLAAALALPLGPLLDAWSERDALLGAPVAWTAPGGGTALAGTADGIDDRGRLRVRSERGTVRALDAGEVHLRSTPGGVLAAAGAQTGW